MAENIEKVTENVKFPRAVILIVIFQYCIKFSHNSLKGTLPFYLSDILNYKNDEATVLLHAFYAFTFVFSVVGGILADSYLGIFRSTVSFSIITVAGLIVLSATATPPLHLPIRSFTIVALFISAFGQGAIRPCTVALGGNQFVLPQQEKQLSLLFVFLCIAENIASMSASFIMPVLRKDLTCFGQLSCYSLVFIVPTVLLTVATTMIFVTKRFYKANKPEANILVQVIKCVFHAISQRFKTKEKHQHWLDYGKSQCDSKLIEDIKSVSCILKLLLPLSMFWCLFVGANSLWIFQASRMNGEIGEYLLKPDQIHLANSLSVIIFAPIFHHYVYPFLAKFFAISTPLRRITLGCFITAFAYYISAVVELNVEPSYAKIPTKGLAQLRIYNTLDCNVSMAMDGENFVVNGLDVWQKIDIVTDDRKVLNYKGDFRNCSISRKIPHVISGQLEVIEKQAISWAIIESGMSYKFIDRVEKSNSGDPIVRTLININNDFKEKDVVLNLVNKGQILKQIKLPREFMRSEFEEVAHKNYDLYLNDRLVESNVPLKLGGVYTILGHVSKSSAEIRTVTVTQPNSIHILWAVPQLILLAFSEIMVNVLVAEFAYSQAPTTMKALLQSFWLFLGVVGNLIVIIITEAHFFERQVFVLFLYAVLMTISATIFGILAKFYTYRTFKQHNSE